MAQQEPVETDEATRLIDPFGGPGDEDPEFHPDESAEDPPWGEELDEDEELDGEPEEGTSPPAE